MRKNNKSMTSKFIRCATIVLAGALCIFGGKESQAASGKTHQESRCLPKGVFEQVTLQDIAKSNKQGSKMLNRIKAKAEVSKDTKSIPFLAIVVGFENISYRDDYNHYEKLFGEANEYSVTKAYLDNSEGQFTFLPGEENCAYTNGDTTNLYDEENDGIIHVDIPMKHYCWDFDYDSIDIQKQVDSYNKAMFYALEEAEKYVNFQNYDSNGDGKIQNSELALGFVFAGYDASFEEYVKDNEDLELRIPDRKLMLWPHASGMDESYFTDDGVQLLHYIAVAENLYQQKNDEDEYEDCDDIRENNSTFVHELGHYLGLPDLYDTQQMRNQPWGEYAVDILSVMATNAIDDYNNNKGFSTFDAYSKYFLGWVQPEEVTETGIYEISGVSSEKGCHILKIPTERENEYYLAEVRDFTQGIEKPYAYIFSTVGLIGKKTNPASKGGILLWHVDETVFEKYGLALEDSELKNKINTPDHHPGLMPMYVELDKELDQELDQDLEPTTVGKISLEYNPFLSKENWYFGEEAVPFVLYPDKDSPDRPRYRTESLATKYYIDSEASSDMEISIVHNHVFSLYRYNGDATTQKDGTETAVCGCGVKNTRVKPGTKLPLIKPTPSPIPVLENIKLSKVKVKKGSKKITGKVSVAGATVKIKVGAKAYKKAKVSGKNFSLKVKKLKKNTKITIKVSGKGYNTLTKNYKVK